MRFGLRARLRLPAIVTSAADSLDAAHRKGIVYRDLNADNIILAKTGAKLLEFGLAKAAYSGCLRDAAGNF
jgi:serine/threonine protein kinase